MKTVNGRTNKYIQCIIILALFLFLVSFAQGQLKSKPNIVIILADDYGVGDIQSHYPENKVPSPELDRLAIQSLRFTDAHTSSAVCTPTRYSLLTGRYAWRTKLQEWVMAPWDGPLIDQKRQTLPEMLQSQGYHTSLVGKWHLGMKWPGKTEEALEDTITDGPNQHGFDYYFGVDVPNFAPYAWIENDRLLTPVPGFYDAKDARSRWMMGRSPGPMASGWAFEDILPELTRKCVQIIDEKANTTEPFFLLFTMTSPHEPIAPSKEFQGKSGIAPIADFLIQTDHSVGQVVKAIDKAGVKDNTIIIFTADNGHNHYTDWESLVKAGHQPSGEFRGHKGDIWEGGHRVPFLVRWPGTIRPGTSCKSLVGLQDIYATIADLLECELPAGDAEDSFSFLKALVDPSQKVREEIISHSNHGEFSLREGDWKLVLRCANGVRNNSRGQTCIPELYNLKIDIGETEELSKTHPERVKEMMAKLESMINQGRTRPGPPDQNDVMVYWKETQPNRSLRWDN
ncbi:MAG: arylsulfatase [Puniceicoccaceae bacterium]